MGRKFFASLIALCLISACQTTTLDLPDDVKIEASESDVIDPREIVVITPSAIDARSLVQKALPLGYRVRARDNLAGLDLVMLTLEIPAGQDGGSAIRELEGLEPSVTAGVNHGYVPQSAPIDTGDLNYAARLLNWSPEGCPAAGPIGLLDTAIPGDLMGQVTSRDFSRVADTSEPPRHGQDVLGVILAPGLLTDVDVVHADVVSPNARLGDAASVDTLLRGINWMIANDVKVVNISLAGPYNKILDRAFQLAAQKGIIVVAAAGNDGPDEGLRYPAGFASTLAVTAIDAELKIYQKAVRGDRLDFSAPGVDVQSGLGAPRFVSGTSIAAPFVTLRIAGDSDLMALGNVDAVRGALAETVRDLGEAGHDPMFGYGLITAPPDCRR
ncbi:MAG: S8 family serine peptidase [Pseudomonadota bacterium]